MTGIQMIVHVAQAAKIDRLPAYSAHEEVFALVERFGPLDLADPGVQCFAVGFHADSTKVPPIRSDLDILRALPS